jgi:predicted metal-binding membrane protein
LSDVPFGARDALLVFAMWAIMMIVMMLRSATPLLYIFGKTRAAGGERRVSLSVLMLALGYLTAWFGFSTVAATTQLALHKSALMSPEMWITSPYLAAAVLLIAGIFQFTPFKRECLTQCRTPVEFLMTHWRSGKFGAYQMGMRHGIFCVGCCWATMLILFVVGVMNPAWVLLLAAFIFAEKIAPHGRRIAQLGGAIMIAFGIELTLIASVH